LGIVNQRYQAAVELGFESEEIDASIKKAKTALKDSKFDEASEWAAKSRKDVVSLFKENVSNLISTTQLLVVEGKSMGMDTSRAEDLMTTSKGLFEAESYEDAAKNVKEAKEEMERLKSLSEKSSELIKNAENLMSAMDDMNVQTPRSKALLEEAKAKKEAQQFEEAIELAQRCQNELNGERDEYITTTIASFEDVIVKAKEDGVNTKTAERLIKDAKNLFEKGEFRKSLEVAMQSESEVERVGLQQDMASKAINTVSNKLQDFSAQAPAAEKLLNKSTKAYDKGDYVKALELAIKGGDEFSKIKDSHESASSSLERAREVMQMAKDVGADLEEVISLLKEANKAMKDGEGDKAKELAEECMAKATEGAKIKLTSRLEDVTKGIERCENLDIDTEGVRWMISEANALLESENYTQAMDIIVGSEEAVRNGLKDKVGEVIENSEAAIIHATKMDADVTESQNLIDEAKAAVEKGEFETAIELAGKSVEAVESKRRLEKEFFDLSYQATTTISSAKKFGIDVKDAEKTLMTALELKETDREKSLELAQEAFESAKASMDAFSPVLETVIEIKDPKIDEWSEAKITLTNSGKALAKNIVIEILGAAEVEGLELIPTLRAKAFEELPVKIKITGTGEVPLAIKATTIRIFDEKAYEFETVATVSVGAREEIKVETAEESTNCPICMGAIKKGLKVVKCKKCGDVFHELCAKTAETCPKCEAAIS
jgi:tetratricopeptide (TPR) repeat protein